MLMLTNNKMHCLIFVTVVFDYDAEMSSLYSPAHAEDPVCFCRYVH